MILNPPYQAHTVVPRRRGPIFQRRRLWVPSISAFTRVHSPSKTVVNALNDALYAGTTSVTIEYASAFTRRAASATP